MIAEAVLQLVINRLDKLMKGCDRECVKMQDCVDCCNAAALSAHVALGAATTKATFECLKFGPFGAVVCAGLVHTAHYDGAKQISAAQDKCNNSCMDNPL